MSKRRRRHNKPTLVNNHSQPSQLRQAYEQFVEEVAYARADAEREAYTNNRPVQDFLDLSKALDVLNANPTLMTYMQTIVERQQARDEVTAVGSGAGVRKYGFNPNTTKGAASEAGDLGAVGTGQNIRMSTYNQPNSLNQVPNADILRAWAEQVEWVRAAINIRREQIGRAALVVRPIDETKPFDKNVQQAIEGILEEPNEYRESLRTLIEEVLEDVLVLDRGVIEKNMTAKRLPTAIYASDGALFKIYTGWSGNPDEPRYLYEDPQTHRKVPLRNDEVIMICANPATYRFGLSPVQVLRKAILADIKATESAMHLVEGKPPQHIVQMPKASKPQLQKVRDAYDQEVAGRRELLFVGGEETIHIFPLMFSAKDNQWMEWQQYLALKIATIFQISPQQLGLTMNINKANGDVQQELYEDTGLIPLMLLVEEYLNRELLADFAPRRPDGRPDYEKMNLQILFPAVSEADRILHVERMVQMSKDLLGGNMPSATVNQVLSMRGEEPVEGGDTFWVYTAKNGQVPWLSYDKDFDYLAANNLNPDGSRAAAPLASISTSADQADATETGDVTEDDTDQGVQDNQAVDQPGGAPAKPPKNPSAPPKPTAQPSGNTPPGETTPAHPKAPGQKAAGFWSLGDGRRAGNRWSVSLQQEATAKHAEYRARGRDLQTFGVHSDYLHTAAAGKPVNDAALNNHLQYTLQPIASRGEAAVKAVFMAVVDKARAKQKSVGLTDEQLDNLGDMYDADLLSANDLTAAIVQMLVDAYATSYIAHSKKVHAVLPPNWEPPLKVLEQFQSYASKTTADIISSYDTQIDNLVDDVTRDFNEDPNTDTEGIEQIFAAQVTSFVLWKSKQIARTETNTGANSAADDMVDAIQSGELTVSNTDDLVVVVMPDTSSNDVCADWAGQYVPISQADEVPDFPIHPNCIHLKYIDYASNVQ